MKKKILFIDRDGTLVKEPPSDYQLDHFEKLEFFPGVLRFLPMICEETDYLLVMVTNQDGLGTDAFPENTFWPVHNLMMKTFENEGVHFQKVHIDRSFGDHPSPGRKPGTAMLEEYFDASKYDLKHSYVIGDRKSDIELAKNLGAKAIFLFGGPSSDAELSDELMEFCSLQAENWESIYRHLKQPDRKISHERNTKETQISIHLNLDGSGKAKISTGVGFFDHMLEQIARHGNIDIDIKAKGDLHIDEHHLIEDTAITLGETFLKALGDKKGIERYGFCLPMDDCLAQVALDFGGRNWLVWETAFEREKVGDLPTEMFEHFFKSFSDAAKANINIKAEGENEHHKIEAIFKAFAKAIKMAVKRDLNNDSLPSTKGLL